MLEQLAGTRKVIYLPAICQCSDAFSVSQCPQQDPMLCSPPSMHVECSYLHPSVCLTLPQRHIIKHRMVEYILMHFNALHLLSSMHLWWKENTRANLPTQSCSWMIDKALTWIKTIMWYTLLFNICPQLWQSWWEFCNLRPQWKPEEAKPDQIR